VVGIDGSDPSRAAVAWAAREAAMRNVPLTLVHVVNVRYTTMPQTPLPVGFGGWLEEQGQTFLQDAERIAMGSGLSRVDAEMFTAATIPTLIDESEHAEMLVVGCRGRPALARVLLGSVSAAMVAHAHCPVAVIHADDALPPPPARAPVLVGIDISPASDAAAAVAFDEASRRGVELIALHAWSDEQLSKFPGFDWSATATDEEELLAQRLAGWQERYPDVLVRRVVVCDDAAHQLHVGSKSAQLVVVGSHGRGGFPGMLIGSVARAVVQSARVPVIVVRKG
jgi:nucleotide-binding universal stress UspA family protein